MNTKALITLEYDKIIKKLETFASSTMGKALCKDLLPSSDYEEILSAQTETKDALTGFIRRVIFLFRDFLISVHI